MKTYQIWKAVREDGSFCEFWIQKIALDWAGEGGTVERVVLDNANGRPRGVTGGAAPPVLLPEK